MEPGHEERNKIQDSGCMIHGTECKIQFVRKRACYIVNLYLRLSEGICVLILYI